MAPACGLTQKSPSSGFVTDCTPTLRWTTKFAGGPGAKVSPLTSTASRAPAALAPPMAGDDAEDEEEMSAPEWSTISVKGN
jgi:hypothetical protein